MSLHLLLTCSNLLCSFIWRSPILSPIEDNLVLILSSMSDKFLPIISMFEWHWDSFTRIKSWTLSSFSSMCLFNFSSSMLLTFYFSLTVSPKWDNIFASNDGINSFLMISKMEWFKTSLKLLTQESSKVPGIFSAVLCNSDRNFEKRTSSLSSNNKGPLLDKSFVKLLKKNSLQEG